jgi:hypothetical protein
LIGAVLRVPREFWNDNPQLWWAVYEIVGAIEIIRDTLDESIMPAAQAFKAMNPDLDADRPNR